MAATPDEVWAVLGDVRRMPDLSPELVRMIALKPGGLRRGQWYLGINRRGLVVWPTRSTVTDVEPERLLAWDTAHQRRALGLGAGRPTARPPSSCIAVRCRGG